MSISGPDRNLDTAIVREIFGWKETEIPPDAKGENECVILTRDGSIPADFDLPKLGKLHPGYFAPFYSTRWEEAINLAKHVGLNLKISELPSTARELTVMSLEHWRANKGS